MNKLSKHVLGMKFMRRTKEQVTTDKTETTFRQHFSKSKESKKSHSTPPPESKSILNISINEGFSCEIEEVGSYSQCEGHIFGRQSFGGFNPVVESNVSKGIWKPFYLDAADEGLEDGNPNSDLDSEPEDDEVDVPDKEMARTFGSLVGTLGKKFLRKRDRGGEDGRKKKGETSSNSKTKDGRQTQKEQKNNKIANDKKSRGKWSKGKVERDDFTVDLTNDDDNDEPPKKRSKFMKPSD